MFVVGWGFVVLFFAVCVCVSSIHTADVKMTQLSDSTIFVFTKYLYDDYLPLVKAPLVIWSIITQLGKQSSSKSTEHTCVENEDGLRG